MTDLPHKFAIDPAADGKFYLLINRSLVAGVAGIASWRHAENGASKAFETAADVIAFAKGNFEAADEGFAPDPGQL